eukprot:6187081-Pleurochrysis_carterae.AAC.1
MVNRHGGLSGKQKSEQLKNKRKKQQAKQHGQSAQHKGKDAKQQSAQAAPQYIQQVSKTGVLNALSTRFLREDNEVVAERKLQASQPLREPL